MDSYAAPSFEPKRTSLPVLLAGVVTTALTLLGVWALNQNADDFNIMGWYGYYVIPVGALLVGLAAGSGYGLASWKTGIRISRNLLVTVVLLQLVAYFAAQYLEYRHLLSTEGIDSADLGFFTYFDLATRQFAFKDRDGSEGTALGGWGYGIRFLEIGGFVFGGVLAPLILKSKPYCDECQVYMRTKRLGLLPPASAAPVEIQEVKETHKQEKQGQSDDGQWILEALQAHASSGRTAEFNAILATHKTHQKAYGKLKSRISVGASICPRCYRGQLDAVNLSGRGNAIVRKPLGSTPFGPGFGRELN